MRFSRFLAALLVAAFIVPTASFAQAIATRGALPPPGVPAAKGEPRKLAPGVEQTISPEDRAAEKVSRHDIVETVAGNPNFGVPPGSPAISPAKGVRFEHDVRGFKFGFKPMRMMNVDIPAPSGKMQQKLVWYMIVHVTNPSEDKPLLFAPVIWLEDLDKKTTYPEQLIPVAIAPIQRREDPNRPLTSIVQMSGEFGPGEDRWGVATWTDLDPTIKRFSVFVEGLSTAYQWDDPEGAYQAGEAPGSGRKLLQKTLQINFWRPADPFHEHEAEIRYGLPGDVDYRWVYR